MARRDPDPPFRGPWSDLPPPEPPKREGPFRWPTRGPRGVREPIISNWRGLLIVLFLLFVAPALASWVAHLIMAQMAGR